MTINVYETVCRSIKGGHAYSGLPIVDKPGEFISTGVLSFQFPSNNKLIRVVLFEAAEALVELYVEKLEDMDIHTVQQVVQEGGGTNQRAHIVLYSAFLPAEIIATHAEIKTTVRGKPEKWVSTPYWKRAKLEVVNW